MSLDFYLMKIINVKVNPGSSTSEVIKIDNDNYKVKLKNPPVKGRANNELIEILSNYFKVSKNDVEIVKGKLGNFKIIRIR